MKKLLLNNGFITCLLLTGCGIAFADNPEAQNAPGDSTVTQLEEIVVEGQNQMVTKEGITMLPTRDEKSHAYDAQTLLRNMAPPMLMFNQGSVTTVSGETVSYFIDGVPATETDCASLRPSKVLKVEYFPYSSDPRFAGSRNVINFVMQPLEYGGYMRFSPYQYMGNTFGGYPLYAKYVKKSMTYDFTASAFWSSNHSGGERNVEVFRNLDLTSERLPIIRESDTKEASHSQGYSAAFRALHSRPNGSMFYSTLSFNYGSDGTNSEGMVSFSPEVFPSSATYSHGDSRSVNASWMAYAMMILPKSQYLHIHPSLRYTNSKSNSLYSPLSLPSIQNNSREIAWQPMLTIKYYKQLPNNMILSAFLISATTLYSTDYSGNISETSSPHQKLTTSQNTLSINLFHPLPQNAHYSVSLGGMLSYSKTATSDAVTLLNPIASIGFSYPFSTKSYLNLYGEFSSSTPSPYSSNELMRQENELLWIAGNPEKKNEYSANTKVTYTYLFSNIVSVSAAANYTGKFNRLTPTYLNGGDYIIKSFSADGRWQNLSFSLNIPIKLFNNKFTLTPNLSYWNIWQRGPISGNLSYLSYTVNANAYFGNWSASGYFQGPQKFISSGGYQKSPSQYGVELGWFKGEFSVSASANNWFRTTGGPVFWYDCDLYSTRNETRWRSSYGRSFSVTLRYTLDFGKKVDHGNEVQSSSGISTSIM